jgi:hypothetical protein
MPKTIQKQPRERLHTADSRQAAGAYNRADNGADNRDTCVRGERMQTADRRQTADRKQAADNRADKRADNYTQQPREGLHTSTCVVRGGRQLTAGIQHRADNTTEHTTEQTTETRACVAREGRQLTADR